MIGSAPARESIPLLERQLPLKVLHAVPDSHTTGNPLIIELIRKYLAPSEE
jgi:hypothetical protein